MFEIERHSQRDAYIVRAQGPLANDDLEELRPRLEELTANENEAAILFDLREVTSVSELTAEYLRELPRSTEWQRCHSGARGPRAVLTDSAALYGLARLYQLSSGTEEDHVVRLFRQARPALEYVGFLDADPGEDTSPGP